LWLEEMGATVTGFSLAPHTDPNLFSLLSLKSRSLLGDIRDVPRLTQAMQAADPEVVIHMAAQALVRESYRAPLETFSTNVVGTANVLQVCRNLKNLKCVVVITSDKVYENLGAPKAFSEQDKLGGKDPYSNSKACAELVTQSYRDSFFGEGAKIATARAGNVIGGGDWSADRLIPDCMRALIAKETVSLRYPDATRPWQHVLEPLSGYLTLAEGLIVSPLTAPPAVNFGPDPTAFCTVREVVEAFSRRFSGKPGWRQDAGEHPPEAKSLTLSSALAERTLGWRPRLDVESSLAWTADWYRAHQAGENVAMLTRQQIAEYQRLPLRHP
jgi:CDP-glucose 4,6-dehydratase